MKLEVIHCLIRCHACNGEYKDIEKLCKSGLVQCHPDKSDREVYKRWRIYFLLRLAQCRFISTGSVEKALATLEELDKIAERTKEEDAVAALARAICYFHSNALSEADSALSEMAGIIEAAQETENPHQENADSLLNELQGLYFVMYTSVAQAMGRAGSLKVDADYPVFGHLQETLADRNLSNQDHESCWLSMASTSALGHMIHSAVLRSGGKGSAAAVQLGQAEEILDGALAQNGISWEKTEEDIPTSVLFKVRDVLQLRLVAMEHRALAALLSTDLSTAAEMILASFQALRRYPTILECRKPSVAMIMGQYAHTTCEFSLAISLFAAVASNVKSPAIQRLAASSAALSELQKSSGSESYHHAQKWLQFEQSTSSRHETDSIPTADRTAKQLVQGILLKEQGDIVGARVILTKALKYAHGMIGSMQLVGQVLNALAPVQQEKNDISGAQQMFQSAITLFKSLNDLPSLITTLYGLQGLYQYQKQADLVSKSQQYLSRKEQDLHLRLSNAQASTVHKELMTAATQLL